MVQIFLFVYKSLQLPEHTEGLLDTYGIDPINYIAFNGAFKYYLSVSVFGVGCLSQKADTGWGHLSQNAYMQVLLVLLV